MTKIQAGGTYWYITEHLHVISVKLTRCEKCACDIPLPYPCEAIPSECGVNHLGGYDQSGNQYMYMIPENLFPADYKGHIAALDKAINMAKLKKDHLLAEVDCMEEKMRYLSKERNAVIQK